MAAKKQRSKRRRGRGRPRRRKTTGSGRWLRYWLSRLLAVAGVALIGYIAYLDMTIRRQFEGQRWALPAHVYTRPLELFAGSRLTPEVLRNELEGLGYRRQAHAQRTGTYSAVGDRVEAYLREFTFWDGPRPARFIRVNFRGNRVRAVADRRGEVVDLAQLEPRLIGSVSPMHHEDRSLVRLADVPQALIDALLAVEDRKFYEHFGVDPRGLARALWANLSAGEVVQGGSTLTQQLIKNYYLSAERTVQRKLVEMTMAVLLELHYGKDEILEAYLNEVYLGQAGNRAIHGFGLGSQFYFGRPLHELELPELALLVALVRGASYYNPRRHPERARQRRNLVLDQMEELGFIDGATAAQARAAPLGVPRRGTVVATAYPAFLDLVRRQLRRDYRDEDLHAEGLHIFTTLDPAVQTVVESEVPRRLARLEQARGLPSGSLQAAVVVVRTDNGEVLALAGDRAARFAGFNRALDAERPVGSLIKPVVYLAALEQGGRYTLASRLDDAPLAVEQAGAEVWRPQNYDREFRGQVLLLDGLARSHNVPTARLGMDIGIQTVTATLRRLGLRRELPPYPSLLLGAASMSPLEMTQLYLNFASGGFRLPLRSTRSVLDRQLQPLARYPLSIEQVIEPQPMALLNYALQEVVRTGTARGLVRRFSVDLGLAGKTGTTDSYRDSWFAGYSGDVLALVWVGRDDNNSTGLTGASGAMQLWADIMSRLDLRKLDISMPPQVELLAVDELGRQAEGCLGTRSMPFVVGTEPVDSAPCATTRVVRDAGGKIKRFFERLFNESEN